MLGSDGLLFFPSAPITTGFALIRAHPAEKRCRKIQNFDLEGISSLKGEDLAKVACLDQLLVLAPENDDVFERADR